MGDQIFLYYIGWSNRLDVPYHNNLGLAISNDGGRPFSKFSEGPVFSTSSEEPGYIGTISVMEDGGSFIGGIFHVEIGLKLMGGWNHSMTLNMQPL